MAIDSNLVKLALDGYKGHVAGDYSVNKWRFHQAGH